MKCSKITWGSCPQCGRGLRNINGSGDAPELMCPNHGTNYNKPKKRRARGTR